MPEGPEAYITSAFINGLCCGKTIVNIQWDTYVKQEDRSSSSSCTSLTLSAMICPTISDSVSPLDLLHSTKKSLIMRLTNVPDQFGAASSNQTQV